VRFLEGNPAEMRFDPTFDAVVGRLVLMYCPDPVDFVRKLTGCLRDGGLVVFQEFDCDNCRSCPPAPAYEQAANWIRASLVAGGARLRLGLELFGIYLAAGLPEPSLVMEASIGGGRGCGAYQLIAEVVETLLPLIEKHRIATVAEVEISTLARRMRDEVVARNGVALSPALIGAWSRKGAPNGTNYENN
jgi:Methyltransferase domain